MVNLLSCHRRLSCRVEQKLSGRHGESEETVIRQEVCGSRGIKKAVYVKEEDVRGKDAVSIK